MKQRKKPEDVLRDRMANVMHLDYPDIPFRIDIVADMPLPMNKRLLLKKLHGKWSKGHPDMFVMKCTKKYGGLYLELKATDDVPDNDHTRNQARFHKVLRKMGYKVHFCCGYEDCKKKLKNYLKKVK